jgi:glutamine synthetase
VMERSELVAETLGEQVFSYLIREKRQEVNTYRQQVTPYELNSMLGTV